MYIGELAALAAACFWALASLIYHRVGAVISPLALNGIKGAVAIVLLYLTILITGTHVSISELMPVGILFVSGIIGIGVGDTAFFAALNSFGERRTVLIAETLAPPMTLIIASITLREFLSIGALCGLIIILTGVFWVLSERTSEPSIKQQSRAGLIWACIAALCQAVGSVMARGVMSEADISPLWSATIRLVGGLAFVMIALSVKRKRFEYRRVIKKNVLLPLFAAIIMGTYLGIFLQQVSLKHTNAAITQTLIASSAIFVIPFVIFKGEKVSWRAMTGSLVALVGIVILFRFK